MPCCLFVSDEEVEADPQAFRCETCPVADQLAALDDDPANAQAWRLFHGIVNRMTVDTQTVAWRLERATAEMSADEIDELLARFRLLYDVLSPVPTHDKGDHHGS